MSKSEDAEPRDEGDKTLLDKALSVFAEVKGGEGLTAVVMTVTVFLLLVSYYLLKTVREPLIIATVPEGGAELKSYTTAGQAVLLIGFVQLYAVLTRRLKRVMLLSVCWAFFASNLVLFWLLAQLKVPYLGIAFFLWLGCFSVTVVAQFWSFANDIYSQEQGKRLFAIIGIGMSTGAVAGSYLAKLLVRPIGPYPMMLLAAALLGLCLLLVRMVNAAEARRPRNAKTEDKPVGGKAGFAMLLGDRYLLLIGALILILNWVNTTGEFILDKYIEEAARPIVDAAVGAEAKQAAKEIFVGEFRGDFFTWVNIVGAVLQFFLVSRIIKYLGVRVALFSLPVIALVTNGVMGFVPVLAAVRIAKIAENSTDYSIYNTVKQALWLPTTRAAKYNAKAAVDTFILRIGDLLSGATVALGTYVGLGVTHFALVNMGLVVVWLAVVVLLAREHKKREEATPEGREAATKEVGATA
jgi:ATP:ADP antiporter, AAA family